MQRVIICAGPGSSRIESANQMRSRMPNIDVLLCSTAADIEQQLHQYEGRTSIMAMLQFFLGQHPGGSSGAQNWHSGFMDALERELASRKLRTKPDINTNINAATGSVFFVCAWSSEVEPADVVKCALAIETGFAQKPW